VKVPNAGGIHLADQQTKEKDNSGFVTYRVVITNEGPGVAWHNLQGGGNVVKLTVVSDENGIVATSHTPVGFEAGTKGTAGLYAVPGQTIDELDIDDEIVESRDGEALHAHVAELIATRR
jgi:hypothetical protein